MTEAIKHVIYEKDFEFANAGCHDDRLVMLLLNACEKKEKDEKDDNNGSAMFLIRTKPMGQ